MLFLRTLKCKSARQIERKNCENKPNKQVESFWFILSLNSSGSISKQVTFLIYIYKVSFKGSSSTVVAIFPHYFYRFPTILHVKKVKIAAYSLQLTHSCFIIEGYQFKMVIIQQRFAAQWCTLEISRGTRDSSLAILISIYFLNCQGVFIILFGGT